MTDHTLTVHLRLFAAAKDLVGFQQRSIDLPDGATGIDVLTYLEGIAPQFREWRPYVRLAVNREFVPATDLLQSGDEVAVIPPVSGG